MIFYFERFLYNYNKNLKWDYSLSDHALLFIEYFKNIKYINSQNPHLLLSCVLEIENICLLDKSIYNCL